MSTGVRSFFSNLRKKRIIEILAAFIGGGWLIIEFVDRILVAHYHFPDKTIDITFITLLGALICILLWRWFSGLEKPRKFKLELVLIPLVVLVTVLLDINLLLHLRGPEPEAIPAPKWKNSIAVLPFIDTSPQKDQDWFCDGITDEIINRLSNISELKVPARTSVFFFKGKEQDIREIGKKLGVATVLEGSIQKVETKLRARVQLINIADGFHLWSEEYDRELKDVFAIQDDIALSVVEKLKLTLLSKEKARLLTRPTENLEAYNLYLRGRWFWNKWADVYIQKGMECFQLAITIDPDYALAYAGLATAYNTLAFYGLSPPQEILLKAKELALRALSLDPNLAEAHTAMGFVKVYYDWDWEGGERDFKKAITLSPDDVTAHHLYGYFLVIMNRYEDAFSEIRKALAIDPLNLITNRTLGDFYYHSGQYDQAIESLRRTIEMDPTFSYAHGYLGLSYLQKSMYSEAQKELQREIDLPSGNRPVFLSWMGVAQFKAGNEENGEGILNDLLERSRREYVPPYFFACLYFAKNDKNHGFEYLEKAYRERDSWLPQLTFEHFFDGVRSDQRFQDILHRMNF